MPQMMPHICASVLFLWYWVHDCVPSWSVGVMSTRHVVFKVLHNSFLVLHDCVPSWYTLFSSSFSPWVLCIIKFWIFSSVVSAGTDDDLPQSQYNRAPSRSIVGNGRSNVGSAIYQRMHSDMESQIHNLEQEAYGAVLRAFKAQSDALTWVCGFLHLTFKHHDLHF